MAKPKVKSVVISKLTRGKAKGQFLATFYSKTGKDLCALQPTPKKAKLLKDLENNFGDFLLLDETVSVDTVAQKVKAPKKVEEPAEVSE